MDYSVTPWRLGGQERPRVKGEGRPADYYVPYDRVVLIVLSQVSLLPQLGDPTGQ